MFVGIVGSRKFKYWWFVDLLVKGLKLKYGDGLVVVSGDCKKGVDRYVEISCRVNGVKFEKECVDWSKYGEVGNRVFYERNLRVVKKCNEVYVVVEKGYSGKGSKMVKELCEKLGVKCYWIEFGI